MIIRNIASLFVLAGLTASAASAQWQATAISPTQPINRIATLGSEVIAGNASSLNGYGFIYLSPDEGATAVKDTNQFQYVLGTEGSVIYKGGGTQDVSNGFMAKSVDKGSAWIGFPAAAIEISPNMNTSMSAPLCIAVIGKTLLLGWSNGIVRSTDDGLTWAASNTGLPTGSAAPLGGIQKLLVNGSTVYAGSSGGGMFYSNDDGATWTHVTGSLEGGTITALGAAGTKVYAAAQGLGLYVTANQGLTWTAVNLGGAATDKIVMAFASAGGNLFVGTLGPLKQSSDDGVTWNSIEAGLPTPGYATCLAADSKYLFAGTSLGVWKRELADFPTGINAKVTVPAGRAVGAWMSAGRAVVDRAGFGPAEIYDLAGKSVPGAVVR